MLTTSEINPVISVILPVFNAGSYLVSSVESVLNQSIENFELLIIDDCSADNSWKDINSSKDSGISIFKNEANKGLFYNLNFLIKKARVILLNYGHRMTLCIHIA